VYNDLKDDLKKNDFKTKNGGNKNQDVKER
jgi:hypothetical protein